MGTFETATLLVSLAAIFGFVNFKFLRLPPTIGVMLISLGASVALIALGNIAHPIRAEAQEIVAGIDFHKAVFDGMLAFLLFAGSLHLKTGDLRPEWKSIAVLALLGTFVSTALVGFLCWSAFKLLNVPLPILWCMVFGAFISPTDPIAVLGIMKNVGAPRNLETIIAGESLFNDGIGVAIFLGIAGVVAGGEAPSWSQSLLLLVREASGGAGVGLSAGLFTYVILRSVNNYQVEVLLTLALAMASYSVANALGASGPIAVVVAGVFIGNRGRTFAMSETTRQHLDSFWELIDETLNAVLFLLVGLEVLVMPFNTHYIGAGIVAVTVVLLSRWASVAGCVGLLSLGGRSRQGHITVLTWGGLHGGLSVAMALSLPEGNNRNLVLAITYAVVVFCIFVQGLTAGSMIRWAVPLGSA